MLAFGVVVEWEGAAFGRGGFGGLRAAAGGAEAGHVCERDEVREDGRG